MNGKQFTESTTSGAIASVSVPIGKTQIRGKGVYPNEKGGNLFTGKKTNKKYPNSVKENKDAAEITWDSLDEGLSVKDKISVIEEYALTGSLMESVEQDTKDYFISLASMSDNPIKNKKYIMVPLALLSSGIMIINKPTVMEFIKQDNYGMIFKYKGTEKTYPSKTIRKNSICYTFTFATKKSYDKFRTVLALRFDTLLPEVNNHIKEKTGNISMKNKQNRSIVEAQSMSQSLSNALSKAEPGSKLDQKIKHHNSQVKQTGKGTLDKAPTGYHMDKKSYIRLGVSEAKLDEEDVIIVPGQGNRIKPGFIPKDKDRTDHEVEMAKSDLFQANKNAKKIYELIKDIPETVGLEGWVQEKIIKANDYLNTVREYLEYKQLSEMPGGVIAGGGVGESVAEGSEIKIPTEDGIGWQDIRLLAGEGKLTQKTIKQAIEIIRRQRNERGVAEGYRIVPPIDRERYGDRSYEGLEGPFRARNGKVYYYDPKAGMAYDPDSDIYIDYDELKMMDKDEDLPMENNMKPVKQSVDRIIKDNIFADQISKDREGHYIFRKGYYYRPNGNPEQYAQMISKKLQDLGINNTVVDSGDIWKPFKGGASVKAQSHYYAKIKVDNTISEGLGDDMMALARELGMNPKIRDLKNRVTKPASEPVKRSKLSAEKVAELKKRLSDLEAKLDPNFEHSDDYGVYLHNRSIAQQIHQIKNLIKDQDDSLDEGIVGKVLGGAALLAALWGIGQHQAQQVYSNSPQLQTLIKYHQMATQQGDQAKIQELERRIENHKTRLSLGKGEVMGPDDKPIVPRYESSIMKGIQNEAKKNT